MARSIHFEASQTVLDEKYTEISFKPEIRTVSFQFHLAYSCTSEDEEKQLCQEKMVYADLKYLHGAVIRSFRCKPMLLRNIPN